MATVEIRVDTFSLGDLSRFNEIIGTSPNERYCPTHGETVSISHRNFNANQGGPPFDAFLIGCCTAAIEREVEFIRKTLGQQ